MIKNLYDRQSYRFCEPLGAFCPGRWLKIEFCNECLNPDQNEDYNSEFEDYHVTALEYSYYEYGEIARGPRETENFLSQSNEKP